MVDMLREREAAPEDRRAAGVTGDVDLHDGLAIPSALYGTSVGPSAMAGWQHAAKCVLDRVLAAFAIVLTLPLLLCIAVAIKVTSRGPILYRQDRHGLNREIIKVYKFRTMFQEACYTDSRKPLMQTVRGDRRVTPLGRLLRRTSMDELPQLLNVLGGSMSIVGPRPHAVQQSDHYAGLLVNYDSRYVVKPGMTGWAQVNGQRGEIRSVDDMAARLEFDLDYIYRWSLAFDLQIMVLTVWKGFYHPNAY